MPYLIVVSHPEVIVDPNVPITDWPLSETGRRRAEAFARSDIFSKTSVVWSSAERKAIETAEILSAPWRMTVRLDHRLGENDRSSTGFLPREEFESAANIFFAHPTSSFRGWERAVDAQTRIKTTVLEIVSAHGNGDLAIATHGGVGTLLWCAFNGAPISRCYDQPGQGYFWRADLSTLRPDDGWQSIG